MVELFVVRNVLEIFFYVQNDILGLCPHFITFMTPDTREAKNASKTPPFSNLQSRFRKLVKNENIVVGRAAVEHFANNIVKSGQPKKVAFSQNSK